MESSKPVEANGDSSNETDSDAEKVTDSSSDEEPQEDWRSYRKGGYYPAQLGDLLVDRYYVIRKLGWGQYSTVWLCWDVADRRFVAVKVARSDRHYLESARAEIELLECVRRSDAGDAQRDRVVLLLDAFEVAGVDGGTHVCMVFDVLGPNLSQYMRRSRGGGLPLASVRAIVGQILEALNYLHVKCRIIHADLKLENVLLGVSERHVRRLASEAMELRSSGLKVPASLRSSAPAEFQRLVLEANGCHEELKDAERLVKLVKEQLRLVDSDDGVDPAADGSAEVAQLVDRAVTSSDGESVAINDYQPAMSGDLEGTSLAKGILENSYSYEDSKLECVTGLDNVNCDSGSLETSPENMPRSLDESQTPLQAPDPSQEPCELLGIKVADLGLARWTHKHWVEDVQQSHYRPLEVVIGAEYGTSMDVWSVACVAFALATGDYLFESHATVRCSDYGYSDDEDVLALIVELLGDVPKSILNLGRRSPRYFNEDGELRNGAHLKPRSLCDRLTEECRWDPVLAREFADFLVPMLEYDPNKRATAAECLGHPWLNAS